MSLDKCLSTRRALLKTIEFSIQVTLKGCISFPFPTHGSVFFVVIPLKVTIVATELTVK